jgi:chorismate mutase
MILNRGVDTRLKQLRADMDKIDSNLVSVLAQRFALAAEILKWKQDNNCPLHAPEREWRNIHRAVKLARQHGIEDEDFIRSLYYVILAHPFKQFYQSHFDHFTV